MPIFGPWALYNHLGMDTAIMVLLRSMEKGRAGAAVKYGAARKVQATLTVLWESSPLSKGDPTLSAQLVKGRFIATKCPSEGQWYQHFKTGICSWMGDVVDQDWWAYTIEVLLALIEMYKQEWQMYYLQMPLLSISACVFLLVSALGGMTAYEIGTKTLVSVQPGMGVMSVGILGNMKSGGGTLPPTEKVPSSCLGLGH